MRGAIARACVRAALLAASLSVLTGCYTVGFVAGAALTPVVGAADSFALAVSPGYPPEVTKLQNKSLEDIRDGATYGSSWYGLEYARRLENGIGVSRDPVCAFVIYDENRDAYNGRRSGDRGMARLKNDPAVTNYLASGVRRRISDCIAGYRMPDRFGEMPRPQVTEAPPRND